MKKRGRTRWLVAIVTVGVLMLSACSTGDEDFIIDVSGKPQATEARGVAFFGEWTVDKQVVDTARLEVTDVFKVRLPEIYLLSLYFKGANTAAYSDKSDEAEDTINTPTISTTGVPANIEIQDHGYTNAAVFSDFTTTTEKHDGVTLYRSAYFVFIFDDVKYLFELLSTENGGAVYRADTMGWTIAIPVDRFRITNTETMEEQEQMLKSPITLYYNTKERID